MIIKHVPFMKEVSTTETWTNSNPWLNGMRMKYVGYIMQKGSSNIYYQDQHSQKSEKSYDHQNHTFSNLKYSCRLHTTLGFGYQHFLVWSLDSKRLNFQVHWLQLGISAKDLLIIVISMTGHLSGVCYKFILFCWKNILLVLPCVVHVMVMVMCKWSSSWSSSLEHSNVSSAPPSITIFLLMIIIKCGPNFVTLWYW